MEEFNEIEQRYLTLLKQQEDYRKQSAKQFWLRDKDMNTRHFHVVDNGRRKKKRIEKLQDEAGQWVDDSESLSVIVSSHFQTLFAPSVSNYDPILKMVNGVVSNEDNAMLLDPFTYEELKQHCFL